MPPSQKESYSQIVNWKQQARFTQCKQESSYLDQLDKLEQLSVSKSDFALPELFKLSPREKAKQTERETTPAPATESQLTTSEWLKGIREGIRAGLPFLEIDYNTPGLFKPREDVSQPVNKDDVPAAANEPTPPKYTPRREQRSSANSRFSKPTSLRILRPEARMAESGSKDKMPQAKRPVESV